MEELLDQLKSRIESLLQRHEQMEQTQQGLQQNQRALLNEKNKLQEKHQGAISQIEQMIAKLKSLEKSSS